MNGRVLDAVRIVPAVLWRHLGEQFNVAAPDLASLRAMYGRGNTLFEHQQLECEVLDFHWLSEQQRRALSGALRLELILGMLVRSIVVEREPIYRAQETVNGFAAGLFGVAADDVVNRRFREKFRRPTPLVPTESPYQ